MITSSQLNTLHNGQNFKLSKYPIYGEQKNINRFSSDNEDNFVKFKPNSHISSFFDGSNRIMEKRQMLNIIRHCALNMKE